jgi:hypothetical protein
MCREYDFTVITVEAHGVAAAGSQSIPADADLAFWPCFEPNKPNFAPMANSR